MNIENVLKSVAKMNKNAHHPTNLILLLFAMLLWSTAISATTKQEADMAYKHGSYQEAIKMYEELLKQGVSADLYYNLGNAYYRTDDQMCIRDRPNCNAS